MDRSAAGTTPTSPAPRTGGTGSEFRSLAAGTSMERRPHAHARSALS
jgi:hypothetical protein